METAPAAKAEPVFTPAQIEFFEKKIRPVLAESCFECHTGTKAKLGLQLNHRKGWLGGSDYRQVVDAKEAAKSVVIRAVSHTGEKGIPSMPENGDKLSPEVIANLTEWIAMGLPWPEEEQPASDSDPRQHWSFQPVNPAPLPADAGHPIDYFIHKAQAEAGVAPSPRADRATLYRRLDFALLGLPPKYEELKRFVEDPRPDDEAYTALVDHLLGSPHYGERWARLWMDVARYADTKGYEGAGRERRFIYSYTYRDWLIRAFNEDLPYDKFLLYQLAAEQLVDASGPDKRHLAALGFLSLSKNGSQDEILDDRIDTTFRGTMALTVSCAKCHDHKFDPVPTKEYYGLYGVFLNSLTVDTPTIGEPKKGPEYDAYLKGLAEKQKKIDDFLNPILEKLKKEHPDLANNQGALMGKVDREDRRKLTNLEGERDKFVADSGMEADKAIILRDREKPINQHVFIRGNPGRPGELAPRQFLSIASEGGVAKPFEKGSGRLELAQAITRPGNPLTTRNLVNRVWMWHFGEGIVRTVDDFGITGERPDHPELLDWLANWFLENGSSIKKLHRLIVTSETWKQQSSNPKATENLLVDAENRLLWKFKKRRLELEQMRDAMLDVAGNLDNTQFGRPVEILEPGYANRRSVYAFIDRQNLNPAFRNFDFSNPQETTGKRPSTTIPMQALFTLNNPFVMDQAEILAKRSESALDRIASLHEAVFAKEPSEPDRQLAESFLAAFGSESSAMGRRQTNTEWSYGWGDIDPQSGKVVFNAFEHWIKGVWQVGKERPLKDNPLSYLYADDKGNTHSGHTSKESAIYQWRAPDDLVVSVSGELLRPNVGKGNGVRVKVATSSEGVIFDQVLDPSKDRLPVSLPEVKVAKNDCLYFIVDPHENNSSFDSVRWNPQITDLSGHWPRWGMAESFSGPATPATTWGAYAHALLNTNRFLFID
ncbi:MAG: PSD1 domain-containing protein [Verrucomicrobiae bacterium]|nr:PSD1 domain-containing protein [Verrucomicrobiae bacterium]